MLKKAKRDNPLPITSFYEDSFELHKRNKRQSAAQYLGNSPILHRAVVLAIRLIITALAVAMAFWLYTLVDEWLMYLR